VFKLGDRYLIILALYVYNIYVYFYIPRYLYTGKIYQSKTSCKLI